MSRNGHTFTQWDTLKRDIVASIRRRSAVLDGEIACLDADGRSNFYRLLFRRTVPFFMAFDLLAVDGEDVRQLPLLERKRRLLGVMPGVLSRVRYVDHVREHGRQFFELACQRDLEGIVAKWAHGTYPSDGRSTSWLKIKHAGYSQAEGRHELFEARRGRIGGWPRRVAPPALLLR